jgi:hypothetical protein
MKTIKLILVGSSFFIFAACSTMKVKVDVLNKAAIEETYPYKLVFYKQLEKEALASNKDDVKKSLDLIIDFITKNKDNFPVGSGQTTIGILDQKFDSFWKTFEGKRNDLVKALSKRKEDPASSPEQAIAEYQISKKALQTFFFDAKEQIVSSVSPGSLQNADFLASLATLEVKVKVQASLFGESIAGDPVASVVATAPEFYWKKFKTKTVAASNADLGKRASYAETRKARYNNTVARTYFGNSDIAIKMNDDNPGEFIVKGVRVDADEVIRSSFKVLAQGIKYMAMSAGVNLKGPNGNSLNIPEITNFNAQTRAFTNLKTQYETATEAFLSIVIDVKKDLSKAGDKVSEADKTKNIQRLQTAYEVYKKSLNNN